ncbi:MAG: glycosyltransferase family 39 protein [Anaerolineae bacterium]|nr:glycosyltransferase family 39 protein [Anaerolineae bacterium]
MSTLLNRSLWVGSVLTLAAFGLRTFELAKQSFWYDEAFSVYLARFDLATITARTAADIQPPLYYYLLNLWMTGAGDSEFAVRFLSLFFGVLIVPLMFVTARRLFGQNAALFAALIATLSALYLWYSQEARMYTLITFLGLLSSYALLRGLGGAGGGRRWWIVFVVANLAAVYTHYFAFAPLAFQIVYALWANFRYQLKALRAILVSFAVILVAFLPWVPFMLNRLGEDASYFRGDLKLDEALRHIAINFAVGESVLEGIAQYIALGWLAGLAIAVAAVVVDARLGTKDEGRRTNDEGRTTKVEGRGTTDDGRTTKDEGRRTNDEGRRTKGEGKPTANGLVFTLLYLVIPLVLLLFLFSRNPKFNARYLMLASPGFYLLLGAGLASLLVLARSKNVLTKVAAAAAMVVTLGFLVLSSLYALSNAYFDPAFTKADFRGVAQYIAAHAQDDEAIVLTSGHLFPAFDYYYQDAKLPELRLPDEATLNADNVLTFEAANELNRGLNGKRGAWVVLWQDEVADPNGVVPMLLSSRGEEQPQDAAFWQVRLRHWTFPDGFAPLPSTPEIANAQESNFQNTFKLLGWDQPKATSADKGAALRLFWQALETTPDDYNVAIRIVDENGTFWGKVDRRPAGLNYPTMRWKEGEIVAGEYVAELLPGTPAGDYYATVTMFTKQNETGLDMLAPNGAPLGKSVRVGPIKILPSEKQPQVVDLKIQHSLSTPLEPFTLLGYQIGREGASTGESVPLTLFWRADKKPDADYTFQLGFGDAFSTPQPLANAAYPTSQWSAGEFVRGQYEVQAPPDGNAWNGNLSLKLAAEGNERVTDLQQPFVLTRTDRNFTEPTPQVRQDANFNNLIGLVGYDLSATELKAGEPLTVTLYWKALGQPEKPYTVFVQLLGGAPPPVAQKDSQPLNGGRPTDTWVEGEFLTDPYTVEIKPDVPPGEYQVLIGWYDSADPSFARLQALDENGSGIGDFVTLDQHVVLSK